MRIDKIYVGWDAREDIAWQVCRHSLKKVLSRDIEIIPLRLDLLREMGFYSRTSHLDENGKKVDAIDGRPFSTDFSFSRFLVPALMGFKGTALFCDCDFLFQADPLELEQLLDPSKAIHCVPHVHVPKEQVKMDGQVQALYRRKNWSSFVVWNCAHPKNAQLTVDEVNTRAGGWLHGFNWLNDDDIGKVDESWNWLEGHSSHDIKPRAIHYTRGGPWFSDYQDVAYAQVWTDALRDYQSGIEPEVSAASSSATF